MASSSIELPEFPTWGQRHIDEKGNPYRCGVGGCVMRIGGTRDGSPLRLATLDDLQSLLEKLPFDKIREALPDEFKKTERALALEEAAAACERLAAPHMSALCWEALAPQFIAAIRALAKGTKP